MRINVFGPPCSGKSTFACKIFSKLKEDNFNVELVTEFIKEWTYLNRKPTEFDQIFVFGNQIHRENLALKAGFEHIVTDCPLLLNCFYTKYMGLPGCKQLIEIAQEFEKQYPSMNVYLSKTHDNFSPIGRYHNEKQIEDIDEKLRIFLAENKIYYLDYPNICSDTCHEEIKFCIEKFGEK